MPLLPPETMADVEMKDLVLVIFGAGLGYVVSRVNSWRDRKAVDLAREAAREAR